ncbi:MAG: hypothetical protein F6K39_44945, partial [Okeania sp. SIO3B3]|nr:hypothetical protein [Okeania sp. SIO3B3]
MPLTDNLRFFILLIKVIPLCPESMRHMIPHFILLLLSGSLASASLAEIQRAQSIDRDRAEIFFQTSAPSGSVLEYSYDTVEWFSGGDASGQSSVILSGLESDRVVFFRLKLHETPASVSNMISVRMKRGVAQNSFEQFNAVLPIQTDTDVGFRWVDRFDDESGWEIQRSTDGGTSWQTRTTLAANVTRFTEPAVEGDLRYRIRVLGASHTSDWMEVTTQSFFSGMQRYHSFGYCKPSTEPLFPAPATLAADEAEKFTLSWTTDETTPATFAILAR